MLFLEALDQLYPYTKGKTGNENQPRELRIFGPIYGPVYFIYFPIVSLER